MMSSFVKITRHTCKSMPSLNNYPGQRHKWVMLFEVRFLVLFQKVVFIKLKLDIARTKRLFVLMYICACDVWWCFGGVYISCFKLL